MKSEALLIALMAVVFLELARVCGQHSEVSEAQTSAQELRHGASVYEAQCAVCHGPSGDGQGMAAHMLLTRPRDFRQGSFKFRTTPSGSIPTDDDLMKVVTDGIRWTAMVGRPDLSASNRRAVVQYLKSFSPRFSEERSPATMVVPPPPAPTPDLVAEGQRLYHDADCARCHGARAEGKGDSAAELRDDWGRAIAASDLTWRPLKRGAAPHDIYLTLATGLNGTPMPAYAAALEPQQIWALAYYLDSLVPDAHKLSPQQQLGEEQVGWMILRRHGMMGHSRMHR